MNICEIICFGDDTLEAVKEEIKYFIGMIPYNSPDTEKLEWRGRFIIGTYENMAGYYSLSFKWTQEKRLESHQ